MDFLEDKSAEDLLRMTLIYLEDVEDEGPHGSGWQSNKLKALIKEIERRGMIRLHPGLVRMTVEECIQRLEREQTNQRERLDKLEIVTGIVLPPRPESP